VNTRNLSYSAQDLDCRLSRTQGTIGYRFLPLFEADHALNVNCCFQSITFREPFQDFSFEELRLADHADLAQKEDATRKALGLSSVLAVPKPEVKEPQDYKTNLPPQSSFSVKPKCGTKTRNALSSPSPRFAKTVIPRQSLFRHTQASEDGLLDSNPSLLPTREMSAMDEAVPLASPSCSPLPRQTGTAVSQTVIGSSSEAQTDPDGKQSPFRFSTLPPSPWNVQVARSPLADFATSEGSPLSSKPLPLRYSPLGLGKHDNSTTQSASVFGCLPKKSLAPDFTSRSTSRLHLNQRQAPHVSAPLLGAQDDSSSNTSGSTYKRQKHVSMTSKAPLGSSIIASDTCSVASTTKEKPGDQIGHMNNSCISF